MIHVLLLSDESYDLTAKCGREFRPAGLVSKKNGE
jgi:hypothetical protein